MPEKFLLTEEAPAFFLEQLQELGFETEVFKNISSSELLEIIENYKGIVVRGKVKIDEEIIQKANHLKYILRPGSGLDIIDLHAAKRRNIEVINSPEGNKDAVAEHALGMLLSLLNHIPKSFDDIKNFVWSRKESTGQEIKGKTIGIIGYGNMGSAFAERLSGFGALVFAYDKFKSGYGNSNVQETTLEFLHKNADILSFHIPLNYENRYLIDKKYLSKFEKPIYLINTSRGKILNLEDLILFIQDRKVLGACLDVLENENFSTYTDQEKEILNRLLKTQEVIITPHVAGWTQESDIKIYSFLIDKLKKVLLEL